MKHINRLPPGAIVRGDDFNRLVEYVTQGQIHTVGPGLTLHRTSAGTALFWLGAAERTGPTCEGGEVLVLSHENPDDDWDRNRDDRPVLYTGDFLEYSTTTHKFIQYYREFKWDRCGKLLEISKEKSREVFEAVECPCQH